MKASAGIAAVCSTILTNQRALVQVYCKSIFHVVYGISVMCRADFISAPSREEIMHAAAIITSTKPHHILSVGDELKASLAYSSEMVGKGIEFLQGPSMNAETFERYQKLRAAA